jgi:hypothetical protein
MERLELVKEALVAKVSALAFSNPTLVAGMQHVSAPR